jgi:hypothetical protein
MASGRGLVDAQSPMGPSSSNLAAIVVAVALLAGCSGSGDSGDPGEPDDFSIPPREPDPATTTPPTIYEAVGDDLCKVVDFGPWLDLFPTLGDLPFSDTTTSGGSQVCSNAMLSETMTVTATVRASYFINSAGVREAFEQNREQALAGEAMVTDVPDLGSGAFWYADENRAVVELYDGNLALTAVCTPVSPGHPLPGDMGPRSVEVARGTLAALAAG